MIATNTKALALTIPFALVLGACGASGATSATAENETVAGDHGERSADGHHHASHGAATAPEPSRVLPDGSRLFGAEISADRSVTPLSEIMASPSRFAGQVVKTEGEISQVCQRMGCWMELRADASSPGIRVPMANHAFFLPRDVVGGRATIEGTVQVEALSEAQRAHLESEGATATQSDVSIEATGVLVRP